MQLRWFRCNKKQKIGINDTILDWTFFPNGFMDDFDEKINLVGNFYNVYRAYL